MYLPAGWPPWQPSSSSTASSMSEAPGQWKQEQRLLWCRKLLLHISCGGTGGRGQGGGKEPRFSVLLESGCLPLHTSQPSPLVAASAFSLWSRLGSSSLGSYSKRGQDIALPGTTPPL